MKKRLNEIWTDFSRAIIWFALAFLFTVICMGMWALFSYERYGLGFEPPPLKLVELPEGMGFNVDSQGKIVMFSLTSCGYCAQKREELKAADIPFTEHFVDLDDKALAYVRDKLAAAGHESGRFGTPVFEINGEMITGNPPLADLQSRL